MSGVAAFFCGVFLRCRNVLKFLYKKNKKVLYLYALVCYYISMLTQESEFKTKGKQFPDKEKVVIVQIA